MQAPSLTRPHGQIQSRSKKCPRSRGPEEAPHRDSPEKGGMGSPGDIITAAAPSSGEGLGHFVPRSEPPGTSITRREEDEGQGSQRTWGCPEDLFTVYPE